MAIVTLPQEGAGVQLQLNSGVGEDAWVKLGAALVSSNDWALVGAGSGHVVTVDGSVVGMTGGISLGSGDTSVGNRLIVHKSGMVVAESYTGDGDIPAVYMRAASGQIINEGFIHGYSTAPGNSLDGTGLFLVAGAAGIAVQNSGIIIGAAQGIRHYAYGLNNTGSKVTLINTGVISGYYVSYEDADNILDPGEPASIDIVINRGVMSGLIRLNHGNDVYDGSAGRLTGRNPHVFAGTGNDLLKPGAHRDIFLGDQSATDEGVDTLDFTTSTAVHLDLSVTTGPNGYRGFAKGDTYQGFENVIGSRLGHDSLLGNAEDNALRGLGGNDILVGGDGVDQLVGGLGRDRLSGGAGQDQFVFSTAREGGDRITDFSTDPLAADTIEISARGFGAGLRAGELAAHQFRARLVNTAADKSDRFIYRTLDDTLWFDRDGSAKKYAPVLLATFNGDILLSQAHFVIV